MDQSSQAIEVKVGALVLFALALLVGFVLVLGDFSFSEGHKFHVRFEHAAGLKPGADVAVAGITIGRVSSIRFDETAQADGDTGPDVGVEATLRINAEQANRVREGSQFYISKQGVLGESYVEIVTPKMDSPPLEADAHVTGHAPPRINALMSKAGTLLDSLINVLDDPAAQDRALINNVAELVRRLNTLLGKHGDDLSTTIDNVRSTSQKSDKLLSSLNRAAGDGSQLATLIDNATATSNTVRGLSGDVQRDYDAIVEPVRTTVDNAVEVSNIAREITTTGRADIEESLDALHSSSQDVKTLTANARKLVSAVEQGEGTVGQLLQDREMYDDMREVLRIIKREPWRMMWKE
jgi:phospholipid/cholesterol/gamma-HCH transport system substrate-binding protein